MHLKKALKFIIVFLIISGWIFSGWPKIWDNPQFPQKIQKAQAAIAIRATGTYVNGTATITPAIPAAQVTGDMMILAVGTKPYNGANSISVATGWTSIGSATDGTVAAGTDTGSMKTELFYKIATSDTETNPQVDNSSNNVSGAVIIVFQKAANETWDTPVGAGGGDASAGTGFSVTASSNPGITAGDLLVGYAAIRSDAGTQSSITITATGATMGAFTESPATDLATTSGGDMAMSGGYVAVSSGTASAAPVYASTLAASHTGSAFIVRLRVIPNVAPTVTLSAATNKEATTATLNGSVSATGGENPTVTVYWGDNDGGQVAGNWDNNSAPTSPSQPQGAVSFYKDVTGLPTGTTIYFSAKATNTGGTGWPAASLNFLTKPAAPTGVSATDGTHTDKVTITWATSTGATDYYVWRDSTDLGSAGDVATFDDTEADAPTITPGSAAASDGTNSAYVELSLSATSTNNGTTHTYIVVASNTTGNSASSTTNTGYRGVGPLTYQWQRSAGDSDASYLNIDGATTASYNDTGAPADGSGRYYKCVENAAGATEQTSTANRGYRAVVGTVSCSSNISSTDFGTLTDASISTAAPNASTTMSCTYASGCTLYVKDAGSGSQPGLYKSTSPTYTIVSATATLSAGTDGYGLQATTTAAGSGGTLSINIIYNKTGNNVGGLSLTDVVLASSTAAITDREVVVTHKAAISAIATAGSYSDTITYSCVGN